MIEFNRRLTLLTILLISPFVSTANSNVIHIYQDADLSVQSESSQAIQQGIESAFAEIDNEINGYNIVFKYLDHRGNVIRSKRNYKKFIDDPNALVIYSGIHSPPLIKNRTFINENKALTLVPWAAGGPITRHPSKENWIFRLSVDDTQAGSVLINYAMKNRQCKQPHLLLEDTPWGDSNLKSMSKALIEHNILDPKISRFNWNIKAKEAYIILGQVIKAKSDCIVLVSNATEGIVLVDEMLNLEHEKRLPIISHWGITGGDFHEHINAEKRESLNLNFIQTCFAFTSNNQSTLSNQVFDRLVNSSKGLIQQPADLKSAVGFIHAYDLTKLLIQAIKQTGLSGNIKDDRNAIRLALESITKPVQGLVKTYRKPFSAFDVVNNPNAHEALHKENYCMGHYGLQNEVLITNE